MAFGDVIRSDSAPTSGTVGIGGDETTIWSVNGSGDTIYELDPSDFSVVRSNSVPDNDSNDIGGDSSAIWYCDGANGSESYFELDPSDFSTITSVSQPGGEDTEGAGGSASVAWGCALFADTYELDTTDLSLVRLVNNGGRLYGIGGDTERIWATDQLNNDIAEYAVSDLSFVRASATSANTSAGGTGETIWAVSSGTVYELDADVATGGATRNALFAFGGM